MTHTPGPWKYDIDRRVVDSSGNLLRVTGIAMPCGYTHDDDESYFNSQLLAAAPDLLEALQLFMDMFNSGDLGRSSKKAQARRAEMWDKANAAVAKAKGQA